MISICCENSTMRRPPSSNFRTVCETKSRHRERTANDVYDDGDEVCTYCECSATTITPARHRLGMTPAVSIKAVLRPTSLGTVYLPEWCAPAVIVRLELGPRALAEKRSCVSREPFSWISTTPPPNYFYPSSSLLTPLPLFNSAEFLCETRILYVPAFSRDQEHSGRSLLVSSYSLFPVANPTLLS